MRVFSLLKKARSYVSSQPSQSQQSQSQNDHSRSNADFSHHTPETLPTPTQSARSSIHSTEHPQPSPTPSRDLWLSSTVLNDFGTYTPASPPPSSSSQRHRPPRLSISAALNFTRGRKRSFPSEPLSAPANSAAAAVGAPFSVGRRPSPPSQRPRPKSDYNDSTAHYAPNALHQGESADEIAIASTSTVRPVSLYQAFEQESHDPRTDAKLYKSKGAVAVDLEVQDYIIPVSEPSDDEGVTQQFKRSSSISDPGSASLWSNVVHRRSMTDARLDESQPFAWSRSSVAGSAKSSAGSARNISSGSGNGGGGSTQLLQPSPRLSGHHGYGHGRASSSGSEENQAQLLPQTNAHGSNTSIVVGVPQPGEPEGTSDTVSGYGSKYIPNVDEYRAYSSILSPRAVFAGATSSSSSSGSNTNPPTPVNMYPPSPRLTIPVPLQPATATAPLSPPTTPRSAYLRTMPSFAAPGSPTTSPTTPTAPALALSSPSSLLHRARSSSSNKTNPRSPSPRSPTTPTPHPLQLELQNTLNSASIHEYGNARRRTHSALFPPSQGVQFQLTRSTSDAVPRRGAEAVGSRTRSVSAGDGRGQRQSYYRFPAEEIERRLREETSSGAEESTSDEEGGSSEGAKGGSWGGGSGYSSEGSLSRYLDEWKQ
ncbi:hypothetical protein BJ742DRAFT_825023 [Cladochytrium replicatum]|nr:hypothetical protein BJ742DRAFT_825023 [Cladochytrium replicatum]